MIVRSIMTLVLFTLSLLAAGQNKLTNKYPIAVKFISYGAGVPHSQPVTDFIRSFQKKNKTKEIKIDTIDRRGKEGEYSLGLRLKELSQTQKKIFIQQIKKVRKQKGDPGIIQYEENVTFDKTKDPTRVKPQAIKIE